MDISPELIFAGQVREIQSHYREAHEAMKNWGLWSRHPGIYLGIKPPWGQTIGNEDLDGWGDRVVKEVLDLLKAEKAKAEAAQEGRADEKQAVEIDVLLHDYESVPTVWRSALRAAYFTRVMPEWQMPMEAGVKSPQDFLMFLDGALAWLQGQMGVSIV